MIYKKITENKQNITRYKDVDETTDPMSYIIKVPAYSIGKELLQKEINRLMNKLQATNYVVGEGQISNDGYSIDYKVIFIASEI